MADSLASLTKWLEQTSLGVLVRESIWGFPIIVAIHIMGLIFSVGFLVWFDARLIGFGLTSSRVSATYRRLIPWAAVGFVSMFITGAMLFTAFASAAVANPYFRIKMLALFLAAANALLYHRVTERDIARWDVDRRPPLAARAAGFISIALWTIVILCGRMMSYTMF